MEKRETLKAGMRWEMEFFKCCSAEFPKPDYKDWNMSVLEVLRSQESRHWNPCEPNTPVSLELFKLVKIYLRSGKEEVKKLKLYCALGTSLDFCHGVDGFFELNGSIATFDLTTNLGKRLTENKAHIIFPRESTLKEVADEIAAILEKKKDSLYST